MLARVPDKVVYVAGATLLGLVGMVVIAATFVLLRAFANLLLEVPILGFLILISIGGVYATKWFIEWTRREVD